MLMVHCYRLLSTWKHYCLLLSTAMKYYGPLSVIIDNYRSRCDSRHGNYVRRFYTGGGDGGDDCQGCGLYSLDDRSGGKRQTENQIEVVMA